jgi:mannobiose 2-epimerase
LVLDAARTLGREDEKVRTKCQALIDYALRLAWHDAGGFFYAGTSEGTITDDTKNWWAQAEGLLGLAAIYRLTGDTRYAEALQGQWAWIRDHQIDPAHGGWFEAVAPDGTPRPPSAKGHAWKAAYHDGRALLYTLRLLR